MTFEELHLNKPKYFLLQYNILLTRRNICFHLEFPPFVPKNLLSRTSLNMSTIYIYWIVELTTPLLKMSYVVVNSDNYLNNEGKLLSNI